MESESSDVLNRFQHGDLGAFEVLFHLHQRAVYGWVLRITRDKAAAEDQTVESFWRMYQAHARFDPKQGFEGWARRIATHAALDWMRRVKPEIELLSETAAPMSADPAVTSEIRSKTALAFGCLPPKLRIAAILAVVEERPHKEVAQALGISVSAVKVRVFRALRLLRKDLERQGIRP